MCSLIAIISPMAIGTIIILCCIHTAGLWDKPIKDLPHFSDFRVGYIAYFGGFALSIGMLIGTFLP